MRTYSPKAGEVTRVWHVIDAQDVVLGRLATHAANLLRGKHKPQYAPRSKRSPNEGGVRTPVMIRWPGKIEPRRDDSTLVSSLDIAPTILAACGLSPTPEMTGINLLPVAAGKSPERDTLVGDDH